MKNVTVVGIGALGSHLVQLTRNFGVQIKVIDFDRVEQRNTASQFHSKPSVGKSKVLGLQQTMNLLWGSKIGTIPHELTSQNDDQILSGSDLIVDCLDNGKARRIVQGFSRRSHTPCLHGALAADGSFGRVVWDKDFVIDDEPSAGAATCEDGAHLPFIVIVSAFMAKAVQQFLANGKLVGFQVRPNGVIQT
jgi:molybdopterin/thiamine biosynthesis adenylyltransferase